MIMTSLYHSILLCNSDVLKISDFKVSRHFGEKTMSWNGWVDVS